MMINVVAAKLQPLLMVLYNIYVQHYFFYGDQAFYSVHIYRCCHIIHAIMYNIILFMVKLIFTQFK